MSTTSVAAPRKQIAKPVDLSNHVAELVSVTNSIITNIQVQSDVNEALTKRLLALEDRICKLEATMRTAAPGAPAASAATFAVPAQQKPAATGPAPSNLRELVQRAAQGQNVTKAIYLGEHLALAQVLDKFKMYVDTRDIGIAPHLLMSGLWELWVTKVFCEFLRPGMVVVDVGANFGYYTLLAAAGVHTDSHVHAIEADPRTFEILNKNVEVNGYDHIVKTYNCAALNTRRDVTFHQYQNHFGSNGIFSDPSDPRIIKSVQVPGMPLDDLITVPVDLMKIDAEGCEPLIFEGMPQLIARSPNIRILMEFAPHMIRATIDPVEFLNRVRRTGLNVKGVSYEGKVEPWPDERLLTPEIHTVCLSRA
jgi:FkbM family methyltransferase